LRLTSGCSNNIQRYGPRSNHIPTSHHIPGANRQRKEQGYRDNGAQSVARPVIDELQRIPPFKRIILAIVEILVYPTLPCSSHVVIGVTIGCRIGQEKLRENCFLRCIQGQRNMGTTRDIALQKMSNPYASFMEQYCGIWPNKRR
jgi:hypothetical protein